MAEVPTSTMPRAATFPSPTLAEDILNAVQVFVMVADGEGQVIYASPSIQRILGYEIQDVLGDGWWERAYSGDPARGREARERCARTARRELAVSNAPRKVRVFAASGEERWTVWLDSKGPGDQLIGVGQDITDLHQAEQMIERREQEFSAVFENSSDGMLILDQNWTYQQANDAACRVFAVAREQIIGKKIGQVKPADIDLTDFARRALRDGSARVEVAFERHNGERREVEVSLRTNFRPGYHLLVQRDITEQRRMQAQLSKAHRLESVGRLAGGVAHDFNNMLTAIRGYAELLQRSVTDEKHKRYADGIYAAATRAADTTQHLLAFSRKQMLQPKLLDINEAIKGTAELLKRLIGEDVDLVLLLSPDTGKVVVDPSQFGQILMNLAVNARDAMSAGGKLIIETRGVELDDEYVLKHMSVEPGRYTMIAVTDTGTGIPPEIMSHIFEPFFTTKDQGKGTGLGLATIYGIVKQSGGHVWVYSEPGQGSTFKIYLPQAQDQGAKERPVKATLLVIEDDETILMPTVQALEEEGYRVLAAKDGAEALGLCQQWSLGIDLVLTDVMAAGMSGEDLMGYFAVKFPTAAVIHMSGFPRARLEQANTFFPDALFVPKPFTIKQLKEEIHSALERRTVNLRDSARES